MYLFPLRPVLYVLFYDLYNLRYIKTFEIMLFIRYEEFFRLIAINPIRNGKHFSDLLQILVHKIINDGKFICRDEKSYSKKKYFCATPYKVTAEWP